MAIKYRHALRLAVMLYTPFYVSLSEPAIVYYTWLCKTHGRRLVHYRNKYKIK